MPRPYQKKSPLDRFWAKVEKTPTCWLWRGAIKDNIDGHGGYGAFWYNHKRGRAHVFAYENLVGPTNGKWVLHHCDIRHCVNPDHLFLGDHQANVADSVQKGRQAKGERNGQHKLTEKDVLKIRSLHSSGYTQKALADCFGVAWATIWGIVHRKRWKHI